MECVNFLKTVNTIQFFSEGPLVVSNLPLEKKKLLLDLVALTPHGSLVAGRCEQRDWELGSQMSDSSALAIACNI